MRLFVNLLYEFKKTEKLSGLFVLLRQALQEHSWEQQRILFDLQDVNDAKTEGRTPHRMLLGEFPQLAPYWKSAFPEYFNQHPYQKPLPPPHSYSYLSNFPGRRAGKPVLPEQDEKIDLTLIGEMFGKIPRPCSFYSALAVLDGIDWFGNCDCTPAMDWVVIYGKSEEDDWEAGYWPFGMDFDEICPFYQSNSVRIGRSWGQGPEIAVQVEVYPGEGLERARKVEAAFAHYFGPPSKRYTRAVYPWEERKSWREKNRRMDAFFRDWSKQMEKQSLQRQEAEKNSVSPFAKRAGRASLKKRFYASNGLEHYALSRWDDVRCFCKTLPHNYHLEIGLLLEAEPAKPDGRSEQNCLCLECIGCNFELRGRLSVENFFSPDGDRAGALAFELWQVYLDRFEAEVAPELFAVYGETPAEFVCDSRRNVRGNEETIGDKYHRF